MGDVGDRPRAAQAGRGDSDLGLTQVDAAGQGLASRGRSAEADLPVDDRLVQVRVAQHDLRQRDRDVGRPVRQVHRPGERHPPPGRDVGRPVDLQPPRLEPGGDVDPVQPHAQARIGQLAVRQPHLSRHRLQRRGALDTQVDRQRARHAAGPQGRVGQRGIRAAIDAQIDGRSVAGGGARNAQVGAARRGGAQVDRKGRALLAHGSGHRDGARKFGDDQSQIGQPRVQVDARRGRPVRGHLQLRVGHVQPLDRDALRPLAGGHIEPGLPRQDRIDPRLAQGQAAGGSGGLDPARGAVIGQPRVGLDRAADAVAKEPQIARVQRGRDIGRPGADLARGTGRQARVLDLRGVDGEDAAPFGAGHGQARLARKGAVHLRLTEGQVAPGPGHGQPADAVTGLGKAALRLQAAAPPRPEGRQRRDVHVAGQIGDARTIGPLHHRAHLVIGQPALGDRHDPVAFRRLQRQLGRPGQRAIRPRRAQGQVLPAARDVDQPCAILLAQRGAGLKSARPIGADRGQVNDRHLRDGVQRALGKAALRSRAQLRVGQPEILQLKALRRLQRAGGQLGLPAQRIVQRLDADAQILGLTVQGQAALVLRSGDLGGGLQRPAQFGAGIRQRRHGHLRAQIAGGRVDQALRGRGQAAGVDAEILDLKAQLVAARLQQDRGFAVQQPVQLRLVQRDVAARHARVNVEAAVQQDVIALDRGIRAAGQRPARDARQARQVGIPGTRIHRQRDAAAQARDQEVAVQTVIRAADPQVGDVDRVAGGKVEPGPPLDLRAHGLGQGRVVEIQIAGGKIDGADDLGQGALVQEDLAAPGQVQRAKRHPVQVQRADAPVQAPAVALRRVIVKGQPPGIHRRPLAREGQRDGHLRGARVAAQHHLQVGLLGRGLVVRRQRPGNAQRLGADVQTRNVQAAGLGPPAFGQQLGVLPKEGPVLRAQQRRDIATQLEPESGAGGAVGAGLAVGADLSGDAGLAVRGQTDVGGEIADLALAADLGGQGGLVIDADKVGQQAVGGLVQAQVQAQDLRLVGIACVQHELAARAVQAVDGQLGRALAPLKADAARDAQRGLDPDDRFAQHHAVGADLFDVQRHGQFGQRKDRRLGLYGRFVRLWQAGQQDLVGGQLRDLDPAAQQGAAVPLDRAVAQGQIGAVLVRDAQFGEGRARGQRALEPLDHHLAPLSGQVAFQQSGQKSAVAVGLGADLGGALAQHGHREQDDKGGDPELAHQNACPNPR